MDRKPKHLLEVKKQYECLHYPRIMERWDKCGIQMEYADKDNWEANKEAIKANTGPSMTLAYQTSARYEQSKENDENLRQE